MIGPCLRLCACSPCSTYCSKLAPLKGMRGTPPRAERRAQSIHGPLTGLATKPDEKCGLVCGRVEAWAVVHPQCGHLRRADKLQLDPVILSVRRQIVRCIADQILTAQLAADARADPGKIVRSVRAE